MKTLRPKSPEASRRRFQLPPAQLAAALLSLGDGVIITDRRWSRGGLGILAANDAFCRMTGYLRDELVGHSTRLLDGPKSNTARLRQWLRVARSGQVHQGEGFLYRKGGERLYSVWSYSVVSGKSRKDSHLVAVYRDITEMRRLQDSLVHAQRLDAVGQLAGGVAHDFNNLLSVINGYCEILGERLAVDPTALRNVEEIHAAGRKAAALTRQLLAFSRRQEMSPTVVSLNQALNELGELLRRLVGPANALTFEFDPQLGNLRVDPSQLQQVILNLVINARDALPTSGGSIKIKTAGAVIAENDGIDLPPGRYIALSVEDNGEGMDPGTQSRLFEPFFTTKEPGKGTGLGLSTVYGIVKQSGGSVVVRSERNVGSTFTIYFPEVREPVQGNPLTLLPLPDTRGRETILLMEEDNLVGKMVAGILTADGYEVLAANHTAEALTMAKRHGRPIDLLIADLTDAHGRGVEMAHELHALKPGFRILCTSNFDEYKPVPWLPASQQALIVKPFALSELLRKSRLLLDAARPA